MPLVTVSELLRLALPPASELMAGTAGSANVVTWARLLRTRPANLGRIEQGEVWLLSAAALQLVGDTRSIARMIRDMAQAGVVAFVTSEALGAEVRAAADQAGTPLVRVPGEGALGEIEKAIISVLVDRDQAIGQRVQGIYERLLSTLVEDRGLEPLGDLPVVESLAERLDAVSVEDHTALPSSATAPASPSAATVPQRLRARHRPIA